MESHIRDGDVLHYPAIENALSILRQRLGKSSNNISEPINDGSFIKDGNQTDNVDDNDHVPYFNTANNASYESIHNINDNYDGHQAGDYSINGTDFQNNTTVDDAAAVNNTSNGTISSKLCNLAHKTAALYMEHHYIPNRRKSNSNTENKHNEVQRTKAVLKACGLLLQTYSNYLIIVAMKSWRLHHRHYHRIRRSYYLIIQRLSKPSHVLRILPLAMQQRCRMRLGKERLALLYNNYRIKRNVFFLWLSII